MWVREARILILEERLSAEGSEPLFYQSDRRFTRKKLNQG